MVSNMACYRFLSLETRKYYEKVSKGLIPERPYDYWGPETAEEKAHWDQWWLPIRYSFHPINWESGFTGRGIAKQKEALEKPGLVGPKDESFVMDVDSVSETVVYRVDSSESSTAEVDMRVEERRSSSLNAASKIYKRTKESILAFLELSCMAMSMDASCSNTATRDLVGGIDNYHL